MKRFLILLIFFLLLDQLHPQNLSGTWLATYHRNEAGNKRNFYYRLSLQQNQDSIYGICEAFNSLSDVNNVRYENREVVAVFRVHNFAWNKFDTTSFELSAEKIITESTSFEQHIPPVFQKMECTIVPESFSINHDIIYSNLPAPENIIGQLELTKISNAVKRWTDDKPLFLKIALPKKNLPTLSFKSFQHKQKNNSKNESSTIVKSLHERLDEVQFLIQTDSLSATIDLYDSGIVDDDTVSLYLNDKVLISQQRISDKPIHQQIKLKSATEYKFLLFAHNMGSIAPNTAELVLHFGNEKHSINLSSSLNKNAVLIVKTSGKKLVD